MPIMPEQLTAIDDKFVSEKDLIVGKDSRGFECSSSVLAERLTQVEVAMILEDHNSRDYSVIAEYLGKGFRGYHNMSPGELYSHFKEQEETFWRLFDDGELPYTEEDDPANQNN